MDNYNFNDMYLRKIGHSSLGMTNKYFKDNYWYKQNLRGYEGLSEEICSMLLKNSNISNFVSYEQCTINNIPGCRSKNFINDTEALVTFQRLYNLTYGGSLKNKIATYSTIDDKVNYVIDFIEEYTGFNCFDYLSNNMYFDMLTLNVDRHFGNLALICDDNGNWKPSPMFDFGASFFSMQHVFKPEMNLTDKYSIMTPQPFSGSFEEQAKYFGKPNIKLNYNQIPEDLQNIEGITSELTELIHIQLDKYKDIFPDLSKENKMHRRINNLLSR